MNDIAIMNFYSGEIYIYTLPPNCKNDFEIEDWIDSMGFTISECTWIINPNITINDER